MRKAGDEGSLRRTEDKKSSVENGKGLNHEHVEVWPGSTELPLGKESTATFPLHV